MNAIEGVVALAAIAAAAVVSCRAMHFVGFLYRGYWK